MTLYGENLAPNVNGKLIATSSFFKMCSTIVYNASNIPVLTLDVERGHWVAGVHGEHFINFTILP